MPRDAYDIAEKRVGRKKKFFTLLAIWIAVSLFLTILNLVGSADHFWAIYPIAGMGLAVAMTGIKAFRLPGLDDWEERAIQKEMDKIHRNRRLRSGEALPEDEEYFDLDDLKQTRPNYRDSDFV